MADGNDIDEYHDSNNNADALHGPLSQFDARKDSEYDLFPSSIPYSS